MHSALYMLGLNLCTCWKSGPHWGLPSPPGFLTLPRNEERERNTNGYWAGHVIGHGVD